jgi:hypothetical protein
MDIAKAEYKWTAEYKRIIRMGSRSSTEWAGYTLLSCSLSQHFSAMSEALSPMFASAPDPCWKIKAHDMAGVILIVPCPKNSLTLVSELKVAIESLNPVYVFERTTLVVRLEEVATAHYDAPDAVGFSPDSASSGETNSALILHNHQSLIQCGLEDGSGVDMFLQDIVWRPRDRSYQDKIMAGAKVASFTYNDVSDRIDAETAAAVAWTLEVRWKPCIPCFIIL